MEEKRYFIKGQEEAGLVDEFVLRQRILTKSLQESSEVRAEDTEQWVRLDQLKLWADVSAESGAGHAEEHEKEDHHDHHEKEDLLEIAFNLIAILAFLGAIVFFIAAVSEASVADGLIGAAIISFFGLLMLAIARVLKYLRTLTEQGATKVGLLSKLNEQE